MRSREREDEDIGHMPNPASALWLAPRALFLHVLFCKSLLWSIHTLHTANFSIHLTMMMMMRVHNWGGMDVFLIDLGPHQSIFLLRKAMWAIFGLFLMCNSASIFYLCLRIGVALAKLWRTSTWKPHWKLDLFWSNLVMVIRSARLCPCWWDMLVWVGLDWVGLDVMSFSLSWGLTDLIT